MSGSGPERGVEDGKFQTTHWSLVLEAARRQAPQSAEALARFCDRYWYPLFAFARRRGYNFAEAQDATQAFFAALLEKEFLKEVTREGGRFRSFLLTAFSRFLANERRSAHAEKRGGKQTVLSINFDEAERRYQNEPFHEITPDHLFEHQWVMTLIEQALDVLRVDYVRAGKGELFDCLKTCLGKQKELPYQDAAARLGMSEGAFKTAVHRFRQRFGEQLRLEIAQTVANPGDVDDELKALFETMRRGT